MASTQQCWFKTTTDGQRPDTSVDSGVIGQPAPPASNCNSQGQCVTYVVGDNQTELVAAVSQADVAIVAIATTSHEGSDRTNLSFSGGQDELVALVAAWQPNTVGRLVLSFWCLPRLWLQLGPCANAGFRWWWPPALVLC
jgi:hypothetical protein